MNEIKQLFLLIQLVYLPNLEAESCTFGTDCALPCRCADPTVGRLTSDDSCNNVTGVCSDAHECFFQAAIYDFIGQHWFGPACQTGNVALAKTATSNNNGIWSGAHHILDGSTAASSCLTVDTGSADIAAEVRINLGQLHIVNQVKLYNSNSSSEAVNLQQFEILGRNSVCASGGNNGPVVGSETLTCSLEQAVDTVTVRKRSNADSPNMLTVCEVAVIGHIYNDVDCSLCNEFQCYENLFCAQCSKGWEGFGCQIPSQCPENCDCSSSSLFDNICQSCKQWYTDVSTDCSYYIDCLYTYDDPVFISATTENSITVNFEQYSPYGMLYGTEVFYYYTIFYKQSNSTDTAYVNGTGLLQHRIHHYIWYLTIDGLSSEQNYTFRLAIYRQQNGIREECQRIEVATDSTLNPGPTVNQTTTVSAADQALANGYYLFYYEYCRNIDLLFDSNSSLTECMELCSSRQNCEAFSFSRDTHECHLKATCVQFFRYRNGAFNTYEKVDSTRCGKRCYCNVASKNVPCQSCRQWYTGVDYQCRYHIECVYTSTGSTPELTHRSNNAILLYFKQLDVSGISSEHFTYYYYTIQYKLSSDTANAFVNGTILLQHDTSLSIYDKRFAMVSGLMEEIQYDFRLAVYRRQNNVAELCHVTAAVSVYTSPGTPGTAITAGESTPSSQPADGDSTYTGLLAGLVFCVAILLIVIIAGIIWVIRSKKAERQTDDHSQSPANGNGHDLPEIVRQASSEVNISVSPPAHGEDRV